VASPETVTIRFPSRLNCAATTAALCLWVPGAPHQSAVPNRLAIQRGGKDAIPVALNEIPRTGSPALQRRGIALRTVCPKPSRWPPARSVKTTCPAAELGERDAASVPQGSVDIRPAPTPTPARIVGNTIKA